MAARRFTAKETTTHRDLQRTLKNMGATGLKVIQDYDTGECTIQFDRAGKRYVFRNARWADPRDNLRATQLTISLLHQALEQYGTTSTETKLGAADPFDQFFAGFQALPDDTVLMLGSGKEHWSEVLGVGPDAAKADVINAFRALARRHHPDVGGNADDFKRLMHAYERAMAEFGG